MSYNVYNRVSDDLAVIVKKSRVLIVCFDMYAIQK